MLDFLTQGQGAGRAALSPLVFYGSVCCRLFCRRQRLQLSRHPH